MSDRYAGRIRIGGTLAARKLAELARAIRDTDSDISANWARIEPGGWLTEKHIRDWLAHRENPTTLDLYAGELVDGSFYRLEQWLCANDMSYLRHSDSYCDVEAEIIGRVDGSNVHADANNAGDAMVRACDVRQAKELLSQGKVLDAMALLSKLLPNVDDIPPFMVEYANGRLR